MEKIAEVGGVKIMAQGSVIYKVLSENSLRGNWRKGQAGTEVRSLEEGLSEGLDNFFFEKSGTAYYAAAEFWYKVDAEKIRRQTRDAVNKSRHVVSVLRAAAIFDLL